MKELELYIHIPFCVRKCKYCDFLSAPAGRRERQEYVDSLCEKLRSYRDIAKAYHVVSIFLGGGTPSILTGEQILQIFAAIRGPFLWTGMRRSPWSATREPWPDPGQKKWDFPGRS